MENKDIIREISEKTGLTVKETEILLQSFMDTVYEKLKKYEPIQIEGLGTFKVAIREARIGRNPKTGRPLHIPATKYPQFVPDDGLIALFRD